MLCPNDALVRAQHTVFTDYAMVRAQQTFFPDYAMVRAQQTFSINDTIGISQ
jgi:hypothetical protein